MSVKNKQIKTVLQKIKKQKAILAKSRDRLRQLEMELSQLSDDCDYALSSLEYAVESLSRWV